LGKREAREVDFCIELVSRSFYDRERGLQEVGKEEEEEAVKK
jgi:hypothetical protein